MCGLGPQSVLAAAHLSDKNTSRLIFSLQHVMNTLSKSWSIRFLDNHGQSLRRCHKKKDLETHPYVCMGTSLGHKDVNSMLQMTVKTALTVSTKRCRQYTKQINEYIELQAAPKSSLTSHQRLRLVWKINQWYILKILWTCLYFYVFYFIFISSCRTPYIYISYISYILY